MAKQPKAIQNLKIDKIAVWDSRNGDNGHDSSTAGFLKGMIGPLPPVHELARQARIELPEYLGEIADAREERSDEIDRGRVAAAKDPGAGGDKTV